jgi:hypothetical protein
MLNIYKNFIFGMAKAWEILSTPLQFGDMKIAPIEMLSWTALGVLLVILIIKLFV